MLNKIICPDCGSELTSVIIERFQIKEFKLDPDNKNVKPLYPEESWEENDYAFHCPECDSLNVDSLLKDAGYIMKPEDEGN